MDPGIRSGSAPALVWMWGGVSHSLSGACWLTDCEEAAIPVKVSKLLSDLCLSLFLSPLTLQMWPAGLNSPLSLCSPVWRENESPVHCVSGQCFPVPTPFPNSVLYLTGPVCLPEKAGVFRDARLTLHQRGCFWDLCEVSILPRVTG